MIEDALNAARAAAAEGVVPGGGTALVQVSSELDSLIESLNGGVKEGVELLQRVLNMPLHCIAQNCGANADDIVVRVAQSPKGIGFNARTGELEDLASAGVMDPVMVSYTALRNAASVASLILTTQTLIADRPDYEDVTAGPATGGGAEHFGRA